jgi:hypothetical protein
MLEILLVSLISIGSNAFSFAPTFCTPPYQLKLRASIVDDGDSQRLVALMSTADKDESAINRTILSLESTFHQDSSTEDAARFRGLIDLYEVQHVLSSNKKNNPVGGKWTRPKGLAQKLFRTRKTYQHLLPLNQTGLSRHTANAVAEAINVISLDALDGLIRAFVILRGDAVPLTSSELTQMNNNRTITPLSNLAVRAYFDPPRILFGKRNKNSYSYLPLQLGPVSDVVLDTTFYDKRFRIGMGGTSGTRFVFARTNDEEANEYKDLLKMPLANKVKVMSRLIAMIVLSLYVASGCAGMSKLWERVLATGFAQRLMQGVMTIISKTPKRLVWNALRVLAGISSFAVGLLVLLISFSSGGIERDEMIPAE